MTEREIVEYWLELCARYIPLESRSAWKEMMFIKIDALKELPAMGQACSISDVINLHIVLPSSQSLRTGMGLLPKLKNRGEENTITTSTMAPTSKSTAEYCETDLPFAWLKKKMFRSR